MEIFEALDFFLRPKILRLYNCCVVACRDCTISWRAAIVIIVVLWRAATILMNVFIIVETLRATSNANLVFGNIFFYCFAVDVRTAILIYRYYLLNKKILNTIF